MSSLKDNRAQLLDYMEQDIRLLAGVMLRAQEIYWTKYNVDIGQCLTLSSLAMRIYRMNYYDQNDSPIYIPSSNQDAFIRRGYYGGQYLTKDNGIRFASSQSRRTSLNYSQGKSLVLVPGAGV